LKKDVISIDRASALIHIPAARPSQIRGITDHDPARGLVPGSSADIESSVAASPNRRVQAGIDYPGSAQIDRSGSRPVIGDPEGTPTVAGGIVSASADVDGARCPFQPNEGRRAALESSPA